MTLIRILTGERANLVVNVQYTWGLRLNADIGPRLWTHGMHRLLRCTAGLKQLA